MTTAKSTVNTIEQQDSATIPLQDVMKRGVCRCGVEMVFQVLMIDGWSSTCLFSKWYRLGPTNLSGHTFLPDSQGFRFFTFVANHPGEDLARLCYWTGRSQDSKCPFLNSVAVWRPPGAGASNPFLMILSAPNASIRGVQVLFGHQKQWSPPLGSGLPWALKWSLIGCSTLYISKLVLWFFENQGYET